VGREPSPAPDPSFTVRRRLNGLLPSDLRVRRVGVAPLGFHARWSASWRRYSYLVADDPAGQDPRTRGHVLWHPRALDVEAMDAAATPFVGEHDFAAFCRAREGASSVRTIHDIGWRRVGRSAGATSPVEFSVRADAFCHSMVRALVGAFIAVGDGRWPVERPAELLAAAQRVPVIATAPAHPLTLVEVGYPPDTDLAAQAERARRWRGR
jgi:tRNA pseudouridine38-40 synthase